jgi:outer membrane receptor protein involved in Fe transport
VLPQTAKQTGISGIVIDSASGKAIEFANVVVLRAKDKHVVTGQTTNAKGMFLIENVPAGEYFLKYSLMGYQDIVSNKFVLSQKNQGYDAGTVRLCESRIKLSEVTVTSQKEVFNNSIDRKVYNVQQDIVSATGTVSDLLQNIPSIQVDVDGNVTLRGSSNMQILVDGKTSPLMQSSSADVLQQIPASSVEKIEVGNYQHRS